MGELLKQIERIEDLMASRRNASFDKSVRFVLAGEPASVGESGEPLVYRTFGISNPVCGGKFLWEAGELGNYDNGGKYVNVGSLEHVMLPADMSEVWVKGDEVKGLTEDARKEHAQRYMENQSRFEESWVRLMHSVGWPYSPEGKVLQAVYRPLEDGFTEPFETLSPVAISLISGNLNKLEQGMKETSGPVVTLKMILQIH